MSAETITRRRERRSTSGPTVRPIAIAGQEVGDQQRGDPRPGVRQVPDLEVERDERHPVSEAGAEGREEEQAQAAHPVEQVGLPPE